MNDENITFQELDGIDNPDTYRIDDIVEVFIRANSGGTKLGKSDLLFSLLISSWDDADAMMEELLETLNQGGFDYDRDFVLKACLTLLDKGAAYDVAKFRDPATKTQIVIHWKQIANAIKTVRDFVISKTYIRSDKALPSYNALIPLIYLSYHYPQQFAQAPGLQEYLLRVLITGAFSGRPDSLIDKIVTVTKTSGEFKLQDIYGVIRNNGRNLDVTTDTIFRQQYGSRTIHLFFNLWYQAFNYEPVLDMNGPQADHIFPQGLLRTIKNDDPAMGSLNVMRYRAGERNQIANCMLLTATENGAGGKSDKPPAIWFDPARFPSAEAHEQYLKVHLIPPDPPCGILKILKGSLKPVKPLLRKSSVSWYDRAESSYDPKTLARNCRPPS